MAERRKAELDKKRQQLAALRKEREERRAALSASVSRAETPQDRPSSSSRAQLDDLISSLLSPSANASRPLTPNPATEETGSPSGRDSARDTHPVVSENEEDLAPPSTSHYTASTQELFELPPKATITYDKGIQTSFAPVASSSTEPESASTAVGRETEAELRARLLREFEAERARLDAEITAERKELEREKQASRLKGLDEGQLAAVFGSTDFVAFLDRSAKVTERALSDGYDYLKDYSISGGQSATSGNTDGKGAACTLTFFDGRWTKNRAVASVDWSSKFQELSLASYTKNPGSIDDPDGIVCVWNLHLKDRPEFVFHSQSDVLSAVFSPFHPNLIVGGTYSGQILLWDTRARSLPVLKTPLSASGHTHPVYSLSITGTQNAHNLVSASTDGTVCSWMLDMLAKPTETLELSHSSHSKTDEVSVTCMAFPSNDATTFWVGTEEGHVYTANRYDRAGYKAGLVQSEVYKGHSGPVLGIDFHPSHGPIDFGDLFLTSGVDWTVKLWRTRSNPNQPKSKPATSTKSISSSVAPLHAFEEADDYVFDVKWHPAHPGMFGTVDGNGRFNLWNINADPELPVVSTQANPESPRALNKLVWEKRTGQHAAMGDAAGRVYIFDLGELARPRENEWDLTRRALSKLAANTGPSK